MAEHFQSLSAQHPATSIYLQTSKGIYEPVEDAWFEHGEATVSFFCGDIPGYFSAKIEGVSQEGLIGKQQFKIKVLQKK